MVHVKSDLTVDEALKSPDGLVVIAVFCNVSLVIYCLINLIHKLSRVPILKSKKATLILRRRTSVCVRAYIRTRFLTKIPIYFNSHII